jgi:hypothetical protein
MPDDEVYNSALQCQQFFFHFETGESKIFCFGFGRAFYMHGRDGWQLCMTIQPLKMIQFRVESRREQMKITSERNRQPSRCTLTGPRARASRSACSRWKNANCGIRDR